MGQQVDFVRVERSRNQDRRARQKFPRTHRVATGTHRTNGQRTDRFDEVPARQRQQDHIRAPEHAVRHHRGSLVVTLGCRSARAGVTGVLECVACG